MYLAEVGVQNVVVVLECWCTLLAQSLAEMLILGQQVQNLCPVRGNQIRVVVQHREVAADEICLVLSELPVAIQHVNFLKILEE